MVKHCIALLLFSFILFSCKTEKKANQQNIENVLEEEKLAMSMESEASYEEISKLIASIPPPVEMSTLILNQDVNYDNQLLHDANQVMQYHDSYSQALNLGIYGTDLGYTYLYEQPSDGIVYFDCVIKLAHELKIEKYFDSQIASKLTRNNHLDSLLTITTDNFAQINTHFITRKNPQLSIALIAGGWIESIYLLSKTYNAKQSEELKNKIGEQKISLQLLCQLLNKYKQDPKIKKLSASFNKLLEKYQDVEITEKVLDGVDTEPVFNDDGTMTFTSNLETIVNVDKDSLDNIISSILAIRNKLIM